MSRCLVLAAELYDPYRSRPRIAFHADGSFTESQQLTAGQIARARRIVATDPALVRFR